MIKISICDDELLFCKTLEKSLMAYCTSHHINAEIRIFNSSIHFLDSYTSDTDIIFLDIRMPLQDGLSVAQEIRRKDIEMLWLIYTRRSERMEDNLLNLTKKLPVLTVIYIIQFFEYIKSFHE